MEIISSQPFLIVFYRKARFPLPLQRKSSFPLKGKLLFRIFYFLS